MYGIAKSGRAIFGAGGVMLAWLGLGLSGCGRYNMVFKVEDTINTGGGGPNAREMLDIDIVAVTKADAEDFPELVSGTMTSKEWYTARREDPKYRRLDKRVYALRSGPPSGQDVKVHEPLVSGRDVEPDEVTVRISHPRTLAAHDAFVVFGRFHDGRGGILPARPVIVRPREKIVIGVGQTQLSPLGSQ